MFCRIVNVIPYVWLKSDLNNDTETGDSMIPEREFKKSNQPMSYASENGNLELSYDMAFRVWQIKKAMIQENQKSEDREKKRSWKQLNRLINEMERSGIVIQDKTGDLYDSGMSVKVIASEPSMNISREIILETVSPTILYNGNIARFGEIVVGIPTITPSRGQQGDER